MVAGGGMKEADLCVCVRGGGLCFLAGESVSEEGVCEGERRSSLCQSWFNAAYNSRSVGEGDLGT